MRFGHENNSAMSYDERKLFNLFREFLPRDIRVQERRAYFPLDLGSSEINEICCKDSHCNKPISRDQILHKLATA
jgi:hypothetical protein